MTIPQEAIEAAARAYDPEAWTARDRLYKSDSAVTQEMLDVMVEYSLGKAQDMLTVALPALERQIREQVAQEIWEARNRVYCATPPTPTDAALKDGYAYAYRIAQGRD